MKTPEATLLVKALETIFPGMYTGKEEYLQETLYDEGIYSGNWDSSTEFEDETPNLRLIQEDEFDQHRTDDMPEWEDITLEVSGGYIFVENT